MKNKWYIIFKKEYLQTVRTKSFIISTILMPVIMLVIFGIPAYTQKKNMETIKQYQVLDESGMIMEKISHNLPGTMRVIPWEGSKEDAVKAVREGDIETFIYVPEDIYESYEFEYYSRSVSDQQRISILRNSMTSILQKAKIAEKGFREDEVREILKKAGIKTFEVSKDMGTKKKSASFSFVLAYILVFLIYISVLTWAPMMLRSTIEDKNNRVVEVVVSHVKSGDIMAGKILGTVGAGVTQYLIWGLMAAAAVGAVISISPGFGGMLSMIVSQIRPSLLLFFIVYFILGYMTYSVVFGAIGAMFSDMKDAQNFMGPLVIVAVLPMVLFMPVSQDPESTMALVLSQIPYFSSLMLMRIGISHVPAVQIALSIFIQVATIALEIWIAGRIYKIGIMSYGKKPTIKEVVSWLK